MLKQHCIVVVIIGIIIETAAVAVDNRSRIGRRIKEELEEKEDAPMTGVVRL